MSTPDSDAELFVCPAEDGARCDHNGRAWMAHRCQFDDGHDGAHECACGHRWTEADDD